MPSSIRLGIVPYLNVLPLLKGLEETFPRENWIFATPRELAQGLAVQRLDIAIVSTFEGLARGYDLLPGAMIGCDGEVRSVAICSKVPIENIKRLTLDRASLSSVALAKIILRERYSIDPVYTVSERPLAPDDDWQKDDSADAWLVIGDTALAWEKAFPVRLDLGSAWKELTGLPFVFAGWYARGGVTLSAQERGVFEEARKAGATSLNEIIGQIPPEKIASHGGYASIRQYLGEAIRYELDTRALEGLERYRQYLWTHGFFGNSES